MTTGIVASRRAACLHHMVVLQFLYHQLQALQRPLYCAPNQKGSLATVSMVV